MVDHRDSVSGADIKINDNPKSQLEQQQLQVRRVIHKTSKDYLKNYVEFIIKST